MAPSWEPPRQEQVGKLLTETQQRCGIERFDPDACSDAWVEYLASIVFPFGSSEFEPRHRIFQLIFFGLQMVFGVFFLVM